MVLLQGCAELKAKVAEGRLETYARVVDKTMVDAFYAAAPDGSTHALRPEFGAARIYLTSLAPSRLSFEETIGSEPQLEMAAKSLSKYRPIGEGDLAAKRFVETAKARGNIVKLYQPALGGRINVIFTQPFVDAPQRIKALNKENALIEWNTAGRPVSIMVRSLQAVTSIGVNIYRYTSIYMGPENMRHLENSINRRTIEESEVTTL